MVLIAKQINFYFLGDNALFQSILLNDFILIDINREVDQLRD